MGKEQDKHEEQEEMLNGVPYRLLDGCDGGPEPSEDRIKELLDGAPDYIKKRVAEVAKERAELEKGKADEQKPYEQ